MLFKKTGFPAFIICILPLVNLFPQTEPSSREMNLLCWQEFRELVPGKINTVLLPIGSLEPHGVIPNGTDNLAPAIMAKAIAERINSLIAPGLNYGITPSMAAYPGAVSISSESFIPFAQNILEGLADNGYLNIIILNGHGGNTAALKSIIPAISQKKRVRILLINWWSLTLDITKEVFGENGGHAANNETAYIQAVYPELIHRERYKADMAMPTSDSWAAVPVPYTISLYEADQGLPTFDAKQAKTFYLKVNQKITEFILRIIASWDKAGLYLDK